MIPKDRMSDILYDVFLLNAAKGINKRILENNGVNPQEFVYKKYHIDSLQFALSNEYYSYDTKTYEGIIEKVKQKIEEEKKKNDALNIKEEKSKDSLKDAVRKNSKPDSIPLLKPSLKSKAFGKDKG
ncbi:MAG: DUF4296 domain-containing protein [Gelidibacter sp.]